MLPSFPMHLVCVNSAIFGLLFLFIVTSAYKDYYKMLGLKRGAKEREIKRAFRDLALKFHPDKNKNPDAEAKFRDIAEAYDVLGDSRKRNQYEKYGSTFEQHQQGGNAHEYDFNYQEFFKKFDESMKDHMKAHQNSHKTAHAETTGFHRNIFDDLWDDEDFASFINFDEFSEFAGDLFNNRGNIMEQFAGRVNSHTTHCHTVTTRIGNTETTYTKCE